MTTLYPFTFKPVYKQYLWGGRRFESVLGRTLESDGIYAESWEVSDHGQEQSIVEAGPLAGMSLHELVVEHGEKLLGIHHPADRFPLLMKFLDANKPLSVQVHPDDALAKRMGLTDLGKTEAWYILQSEPGSRIWAGFSDAVDRQSLAAAVKDGTLERYLHSFEPHSGECLYLPAGTVHALGAGILVAEIQQTSDNTFRLYDWNRVGPDGKARELHVENGLDSLDFNQGPVGPGEPASTDREHVERLVDCDKFVLDRWELSGVQSCGGDRRCHIITVVVGEVQVEGDPGAKPLGPGKTALLPAEIGPVRLTSSGSDPAVLLDSYLP